MTRRISASVLCILAFAALGHASDTPNQKRQNLTDLAIAPAKFANQTKRVFCPIYTAETDYLHCHVLNSRLQIVGTAMVHVAPDDPQVYTDILDRCGGEYWEEISLECTIEADIWVQPDYHYLEARRFYLTR